MRPLTLARGEVDATPSVITAESGGLTTVVMIGLNGLERGLRAA